MEKKVVDITDRSGDFVDFEPGKLKLVVLDGSKSKVSLITISETIDVQSIVLESRKGHAHKITISDEVIL